MGSKALLDILPRLVSLTFFWELFLGSFDILHVELHTIHQRYHLREEEKRVREIAVVEEERRGGGNMKVTWKNTKKKKPSLPPLSHFELDNDPNNDDTPDGRTVRSPNSDQSTQLAMQFQAQGDNLAMKFIYNS
ncbi:hypothetical protein L195_g036954 [Trifolium pratense]|uniref:Uncharacterized protein n=1 Tax=Trifolium pratense TaxID=57577 RepID=A0A2K3LQW9_TRIPR|nr:hypothetical protein L195_g036954 [Trifolium pratense]